MSHLPADIPQASSRARAYLLSTFRNLHRFAFSLLILLVAGGCAYYNTLFNAKNSYEEGLKVLRETADNERTPPNARKHFETTIDKCWKLIEIYSDQNKYADDALLYIAKSEFYLEKHTQAKTHLDQFFKKYAESDLLPEAYLWYAKILLIEDNVEEANDYFRRILNLSEEAEIRSRANFELGRYAFQNEDYEASEKYLQIALKEDLEDALRAELLFFLAESYSKQGKYKEAVDRYKEVGKRQAGLDIEYKATLNLATTYSILGKHKDAYETLRKMLTAPRFKNFTPIIKTTMAENYQREGKYEDAIELYREVIVARRQNPGTARAALNLARLYENEFNNLDSAVTYYGQVGKLFSKFDSVEVADAKFNFLSEYREIRSDLTRDENLVYRLTNDSDFRDSLYQAQYDDSVRIASGDTLQNSEAGDDDDGSLALNNPRQGTTAARRAAQARLDSMNRANEERRQASGFGEDEAFGSPSAGDREGSGEGFPGTRSANTNNRNNEEEEAAEAPIPLEKRKLPEIEFDLMLNRYHLAEFYLLKVEQFDSAIVEYNEFLETYEDSVLTPKGLYSLIYIYKSKDFENPQLVEQYENRLINEYPQSEFALQILQARGQALEDTTPDGEKVAEELFREAEALYFAGDFKQALTKYRQVANMDTSWVTSARAKYAMAWIYEYDMAAKDSALLAYNEIINRYTQAQRYVQKARKKTTEPRPDPVKPSGEEGETDDDAPIADTGEQSTEVGSLDEDERVALTSGDILDEKIAWRRSRGRISNRDDF